MINWNEYHLTHVANIGGWDAFDESECHSCGDFGTALYTNCTFKGTLAYIQRKQFNCNVLVLNFSDMILKQSVGWGQWNGLSLYCFGYYSHELDNEQKVLFCRTVYDNRRYNSGNGIKADIVIGPRADGYIDEDMSFIGEHYYDEQKLIEKYDSLMAADYEPQIAFSQRACNALFYDIDLDDWIDCNEYIRICE